METFWLAQIIWLFDLLGKNYKSEIKLSYYQNWTKWFLACRTQINFVVVWNYTSIEAIKMSCFESVFDWLPKMKYPIKQVKRKMKKTKPKNSRNQRGRSRVLELTDSIKEIKYVWMFWFAQKMNFLELEYVRLLLKKSDNFIFHLPNCWPTDNSQFFAFKIPFLTQ